jgi:hypothetical protein
MLVRLADPTVSAYCIFLLTRQVLVLNIDTDMNAELMAHGYSNAISGLFGGTFEQIFSYSFTFHNFVLTLSNCHACTKRIAKLHVLLELGALRQVWR